MHRSSTWFTACATAATLLLNGYAQATTYQSEAASDTWVGFNAATDFGNRNADATLEAQGGHSTNTRQQRILLGWDLSSIPSGATVTSATLTLRGAQFYNNTGADVDVEIHSIIPGNPWTETSAGWVNYDGSNAWGNTGTGGTTSGGLPGTGNWLGATLGTVTLPNASPTFSTFGTDPAIDLTSLVQQWINGSTANIGITIAIEGGTTDQAWFFIPNVDHVNHAGLDHGPFLTIEYDIPEPASLGLVGLGALALLRRRMA